MPRVEPTDRRRASPAPLGSPVGQASSPASPSSPAAVASVASAALAVVAAIATSGCGDPDRRILDGLSETERARFLRGRQVSIPCWTCHDLAGPVDKVGPSLVGVFGRRSGTAPDQRGSDALVSAAIVWDERSLAAFLADPAGFVPGNRMVSPGVGDPDALRDLVFYLERVTRPGARASGAP